MHSWHCKDKDRQRCGFPLMCACRYCALGKDQRCPLTKEDIIRCVRGLQSTRVTGKLANVVSHNIMLEWQAFGAGAAHV